jgi:hypothetical protein
MRKAQPLLAIGITAFHLHDDQEALLRSLLPGLQPEQQKTMEKILTAFAKPQTKETRH